MPASVETFTKTHEFLRTNDLTFVTLIWSFGPTAAASVRSAVNSASRPNNVPVDRAPRSKRRRSICAGGMMDQPFPGRFYTIALRAHTPLFRPRRAPHTFIHGLSVPGGLVLAIERLAVPFARDRGAQRAAQQVEIIGGFQLGLLHFDLAHDGLDLFTGERESDFTLPRAVRGRFQAQAKGAAATGAAALPFACITARQIAIGGARDQEKHEQHGDVSHARSYHAGPIECLSLV